MRLTDEQLKAADPRVTRLATANAGSGKTHVLVGRVSRLLLRDVAPEDILCLTYTKAAAAEMQSRLFETLGEWSVMENDVLEEAIQDLFEEPLASLSPPIDLDLARQLFAKALETPEGLKVQTIHAFCERILSRFPIEAGIMPGFEPLDDEAQRELKEDVEQQVIMMAAGLGHPDLSNAMRQLTSSRADKTISSLFDWMAGSSEKIRLWKQSGGTDDLAKFLGLENRQTAESIVKDVGAYLIPERLQSLANLLAMSPNKTDQTNAQLCAKAATAIEEARFDCVVPMFFTQGGKVKKSFYTAKAEDGAKALLDDMADQIIKAEYQRRSALILEMTDAVYTIAVEYSDLYQKRKHELRSLDFNDQILLVRNLLKNSEVSDWVTYKLDGGIEHILVDEAQDTSPEQWQIIDTLAEPFFDGKSQDRDRKIPRTLFAVGDEKQSIYSFQGADPQQFLSKIQYYERLANKGEVRMRTSFRSVQDVLNMVDRVLIEGGALREMFPAEDYPPASDIARHKAFRGDSGCVELWPIVPKPEALEDKDPWDTTPVDALGERHQRVKLARQIALTVKDWIDKSEPIFDRKLNATRPMHAGDVLILVQRRNSFFDAIIRQLKKAKVPVAGADRLKLKDALIVKDLLSLARFILLPSDDLSLAEVLKSPLIGFNDAELFDVAVDRDGHLWEALQERRPSEAAMLSAIMEDGMTKPPYDFFAATLDRIGPDGKSLRERFYTRLSMEAREALDAFLARALDHQYRRSSSLHQFVRDFAENDVEIKRDMDAATGMTRVMTVHGAKGLEAPIVFLPDTTSLPKDGGQLAPIGEGFAWKPSSKEWPVVLEPTFEAGKVKTMQEQLRLLYVAMTRAESRLIICGYHNGQSKEGYADISQSNPYRSWYAWLCDAFAGLTTERFQLTHALDGQDGALRFGTLPLAAEQDLDIPALDNDALPDWVSLNAKAEASLTAFSPSQFLDDAAGGMQNALSRAQRPNGLLRGNIIHKLLEVLPDFDASRWEQISNSILSKYTSLTVPQKSDLLTEVINVLTHPDHAAMFEHASLSEVALTGTAKTLPEGMWLNAQIDRLCVTEDEVLIVDYKSDRDPPQSESDIGQSYLLQMAAYRALAEEIYPDHTVRCALLWTSVPQLMRLSNALLDEALQSLQALPKSSLTM